MHFRVLAKSLSVLGLLVRCSLSLSLVRLCLFVLAPLWLVVFSPAFSSDVSPYVSPISLCILAIFRDRWQLPQGVRVTKNYYIGHWLPGWYNCVSTPVLPVHEVRSFNYETSDELTDGVGQNAWDTSAS